MTGKGILRNRVLIFAIITAPFFLNDFFNIFIKNFTDWILLDYIFAKALPLILIAYLFKKGLITYDDLGIKKINITALVFFS
ncbi:MAG: hypothetical protein SVS15_06475, partial [Thermodesulfobacteriota bacterium]|nr:hypothetical protein [Thermodesulfobacteriota bacterium]